MRLVESQSPSNVWYEERTDYGQLWEHLVSAMQNTDFDLLQGNAQFEENHSVVVLSLSIDIFDNSHEYWTSQNTNFSQTYVRLGRKFCWNKRRKAWTWRLQKMLRTLKSTGIFAVISGLLVRKNLWSETFYETDYKKTVDIIDSNIPVSIIWMSDTQLQEQLSPSEYICRCNGASHPLWL